MPPFSSGPGKSYRDNKDGEKDLPAFAFNSSPEAGYRERKTDDSLSDEKQREYSTLESSEGVDIRGVADDYLEKMYKGTLREMQTNEESRDIDPVMVNNPKLTGLSEAVKTLETPSRVSLARNIIAKLLGDELYFQVGSHLAPYSDLISQFEEGGDKSPLHVMREVLKQEGNDGVRMKEVCDTALRKLQEIRLDTYAGADNEVLNQIKIAGLAYKLTIEAQPK
jgi:hypothetical protein